MLAELRLEWIVTVNKRRRTWLEFDEKGRRRKDLERGG